MRDSKENNEMQKYEEEKRNKVKEQIKKYKASLEKQEEPEKETNIIDEITKYLSENPYIIVIAIVVILLIIVIVIRSIKTNKNKIKVNLDLK